MTSSTVLDLHDLHLHSTVSDGSHSPSDLVDLLHDAGVNSFALTDHDNTAGLAEAAQRAGHHQMQCITGVEVSVTWERKSLHIVALNFDPDNTVLQDGLASIRAIRETRAKKIGSKLAKKGIHGAYDATNKLTTNGMITRPHFARFLTDGGWANDTQQAFDRYLGHGKPAYSSVTWVDMVEVIGWIRSAGGIAVLAHPSKYRMTASWMRRLLQVFKNVGGQAIEVVTGNCTANEINTCTGYALRYDLLASAGSDYHGPENPWIKPGRLRPLADKLTPVWTLWQE